ncbi:hypothetical protein BKA67DRAFT_400408 [Truncatella angustata]|uniref:Uncharacterized protein n=1 Tax=Truncatella angustata TaxID=152316 RepID=A0A9P8RPD0_9PEZI|nr:uncharacterized protein BKA67DRAFT_400408 [Truncatella angustata]KAH6647895.1 hypothetical protein BKA67DRAFT_400408 [Truncatella angustata]
MTSQHNAALRGLNAVYLQAPYINAPQDITDLLFLVQCWGLWVQFYHDLRRTRIFPKFEEALQQPGCILSQLRKDMHFVPLLKRLLQWVQVVHPQPELYDHTVLQELIMDLGTIFRPHLAHLISILTGLPRVCGQLGSLEAEAKAAQLSQLYRAYQKEADIAMDPNIVPPMTVRMRDTTYGGGNNWPGLSLVAVHTIDERLSRAHSGAWRFLPCDVWGKPKELLFRGQLFSKATQTAAIPPKLPLKSPARRKEKPVPADISEDQ